MEMSEQRELAAFQQDSAGIYTAGATRKWLPDHQIDSFPHLAASLDMNPIKPVWHLLKEKLRARPRFPTSQAELKVSVQEAWDYITEQDIDKYVDSMQNWVQALIKAKGEHTKY